MHETEDTRERQTLNEVQDTLAVGPPGDPDLLKSGERLDRYLVLQQLGTGGMGAVYAAYDPRLDRKIALKVLRTHVADGDQGQARLRLLREAQAIARISHPNVVNVFDVGIAESRVFVAMEFVDGGTLRQWLKRGTRYWKEIVEIYRAAGRGLAAAHEAGLVHRDFKPDNVLVGKDGRVRVTDFGLARLASSEEQNPTVVSPENLPKEASRHLSSEVTQHGTILGTTGYMAPEQFAGAPPDTRSDQFAFCVALYESLYGERPYSVQQLTSDPNSATLPPQPTRAGVPKRIHEVLSRGLSTKPGCRFPSMVELIRSLHVDPRRRNKVTAVALAVVLLVSGVAWPLYQFEHKQRLLCRGSEAKLASVWGDSQRQAIAVAFLATKLPYAGDTMRSASRLLDAYASRWVAMDKEACEATRLRGDQSEEVLDLRMSCLSQRREELKAMAAIFAEADHKVVEKAVVAAQQLSPVEDCARVDVLKLPIKPPTDAAAKAKVEEVRLRLSHVKALNDAAKYSEALELAKQTAGESENLAYRPLEAEAFLALGSSLWRSGRYDEGQQLLIRAAVTAEASGHDEVVAEARIGLVTVSKDLMKSDQVELWAKLAFAAIDRLGRSDALVQKLENILGIDCKRREKYDEALDHYRRALSLTERANDLGGIEAVTNNIGIVLMRQGKYDEALPYYERSLSLAEKTRGPMHPQVSETLSNIGELMMLRGRYEEAHAYYERALENSERSYPSDHPSVAGALVGVANAHLGLARPAMAIPLLKRALGIYGSKYDGTTFTADAKFAYARAITALKRDPQQARAWAEQAREAFSKVGSTDRKLAEVEEWLARNFPSVSKR